MDDVDIGAVIGARSAPQLARIQYLNPAALARRAGLASGPEATVVLVIDVTPDGSVSSVDLVRSCGQPPVDQAAIEYALATRWIPATFGHKAQSARTRFISRDVME